MAGFVNAVGHRVDPWQGRFMSSAARLTLTNFSLSSLSIFNMGQHRLRSVGETKGIHPHLLHQNSIQQHVHRFSHP
jgi:hypothetical protein